MKILAIIPARSGSKGLKHKNIKLLAGKPLIAYTIEAAIKSDIFDTVMVSTDSEEYAAISKEYGADVPFLRSKEASSDKATTKTAILEVLDQYKNMGKIFDAFYILQPTSPLRSATDIANALSLYTRMNAEAVVSVCEMEHSPLWSNKLPPDNSMEGFLRDEANKPRQQLDQYYRINGAIYLYNEEFYRKHENAYRKGCYAYIMDRESSIDIDNQLDFDIAELMVKKCPAFCSSK